MKLILRRFFPPLAITLSTTIALASAGLAAPMVKLINETQKLTEATPDSNDDFGNSVAISGNLAIVGNETDTDNGASGSASIFAFDGTKWNLQTKLTVPDSPNGQFGLAVAISGNTAFVGAPFDSTLGLDTGAVYVFTFNGSTWTQQQKLFYTGEGSTGSSLFGVSIAFSGTTAVIGAQGYSDPAAYVFTSNGTTWTQTAKLKGSDTVNGDDFGSTVSLSGNRILVGAYNQGIAGAAYVFNFNGTTWSQQAELTPLDGADGDNFGWTVSISGDSAFVGAPNKNAGRGAVYVYAFDGTSWNQQATLKKAGAKQYELFGYSVAISGTTALIGAEVFIQPGAVYEYTLRRNTWTLGAELLATDGVKGDALGIVVAISGTTVLTGAPDTYNASGNGQAYIFSLARKH